MILIPFVSIYIIANDFKSTGDSRITAYGKLVSFTFWKYCSNSIFLTPLKVLGS